MAHGRVIHSHRSSERRFERYIARVDNRPIGVRRLICATTDCGQQGEIFDRHDTGLPPNVIQRKFVEKGWDVGDGPKHDFCPVCVEKRRQERRARRLKPIPTVVSSAPPPIEAKGESVMPVETAVSEPQQMSRSDRRIIFAKLEEVYLDEDRGYQSPWTDASVAKDLGSHIPIGWVSQVRDENFGPTKDNGEIRDMLERVSTAALAAKALLEDTKAVRKDMSAQVERMNDLSRRGTEIGKQLDGLLALAERIKRGV